MAGKDRRSKGSFLVLVSSFTLVLASCQATSHDDPWHAEQVQNGYSALPMATATFYPLYDAVNRILGNDFVDGQLVSANLGWVLNFVGDGEPHDFDPSDPQKMMLAQSSFAIVSLGTNFDGWSADIDTVGKRILASQGAGLLDQDGNPYDEYRSSSDPHVWLSPRRMVKLLDRIYDGIEESYPNREKVPQLYENYLAYRDELQSLDRAFTLELAPFSGHLLVTSHEAFTYLCQDYGLEQLGIGDFADNIPGPDKLANLEDEILDRGVKTIYVESLDSHSGVDTIIEDIQLRTAGRLRIEKATLSALEQVPYDELIAGEDYLSTMLDNLDELVKNLGREI